MSGGGGLLGPGGMGLPQAMGVGGRAVCSEAPVAPGAQGCPVRPLQKQVPLQPRQVPRGEVFWPHGRHLENLEPVDFLGKAKVKGSGFLLLGPKAQGQRRRQAAGWTARPC